MGVPTVIVDFGVWRCPGRVHSSLLSNLNAAGALGLAPLTRVLLVKERKPFSFCDVALRLEDDGAMKATVCVQDLVQVARDAKVRRRGVVQEVPQRHLRRWLRIRADTPRKRRRGLVVGIQKQASVGKEKRATLRDLVVNDQQGIPVRLLRQGEVCHVAATALVPDRPIVGLPSLDAHRVPAKVATTHLVLWTHEHWVTCLDRH